MAVPCWRAPPGQRGPFQSVTIMHASRPDALHSAAGGLITDLPKTFVGLSPGRRPGAFLWPSIELCPINKHCLLSVFEVMYGD
jgi:hypothetical protein